MRSRLTSPIEWQLDVDHVKAFEGAFLAGRKENLLSKTFLNFGPEGGCRLSHDSWSTACFFLVGIQLGICVGGGPVAGISDVFRAKQILRWRAKLKLPIHRTMAKGPACHPTGSNEPGNLLAWMVWWSFSNVSGSMIQLSIFS